MAIPRKPTKSAPVAPLAAPVPAAKLDVPAATAVSEAAITAAVTPVAAPVSLDPAPTLKAVESAAADLQTLLKQNAEKAVAEAKAAQERVRLAAEQSLEKTRAAYEQLKVAAEEATASLETSYAAATKGWAELSQKTYGAMKAHADAHFEHVKAVMSAKTMPDVINLQTAHLKARLEAAGEQIKDFTATAQKVATDAGEPLKAVLTKRFAA